MKKSLEVIINWTDKLSGTLSKASNSISGFAKKNKRVFQGLAAWWTAAFAWITLWVKKATDMAAKSEGTWNKFNTVFWDWADDMKEYVNTLRNEMPLATDQIARMGADMQDLLVPMWLARDEAQDLTEQSLDLANKLAAFNDANPKDVLEAMKSGFTGMSKPLEQFGIDASQSALTLEAQNMWLIEADKRLQDLDPSIRRNVRAQALMSKMTKDSSDAINGFEENSDSLLFRQMELDAKLEEVSTTIGKAFIPVVDSVVTTILPVVDSIISWVSENQDLTRNIIIAGGAISALVAWIWAIWLVVPTVIAWLGAITTAIAILASPITLVIGLVVWLFAAWKTNFLWIQDITKTAIGGIMWFFKGLYEGVKWIVSDIVWEIKKMGEFMKEIPGAWIARFWVDAWKAWISWIKKLASWFRESWWMVSSNTAYMVGERGPEMFIPSTTGRIEPNVSWKSWDNININIKNAVVREEADIQRIWREIKDMFIKEKRRYNNWVY